MSEPNSHGSMDGLCDILSAMRAKGVRLWTAGGQLHYRAPTGALTQEEMARLRNSRDPIVAFLERASCAEDAGAKNGIRMPGQRVPLTFSQIAHWNLHHLGERPGQRHVASAIRLSGRLNLGAMRKAIDEVVGRHEALRTRIVIRDGIPVQDVSQATALDMEFNDLTGVEENSREAEIRRILENDILHPVDVSTDSLLGVRLLKTREDEHVLIVAMEHLISDMASMRILLRDLFIIYGHELRQSASALPEIQMQFADYALWQKSTQQTWIEKHAGYWSERLRGSRRLRFPEDTGALARAQHGWGTISLEIGAQLKSELKEWCRRRRTTLVIGVFTAFVALVLRWCLLADVVIRYQTDGRVSPETQNTIGYFAAVLHLRIRLQAGDSFLDLMRQITEEYCCAHEHADSCYLDAQVPRPEFTRNCGFNWIPASTTEALAPGGAEAPLAFSPIAFVNPVIRTLDFDAEPVMMLCDSGSGLTGGLHFALNRFSVETMERFRRNFLLFLRKLLTQPGERVSEAGIE